MDYLLHILILINIYAILALSLDLLVGHTGFISVAHGAFYAVGAYSSALMALYWGASFLTGLTVGMGVGALFSLAVSLPALRLHEDYLAIATFAFQVITLGVLNNWVGLTRGPLGISGIPLPVIFGVTIKSNPGFFFLTSIFAALAILVAWRVSSSPYGRVLHAIRDDEVFAASLGKNTFAFKIRTFAISSAGAACAGSLYAHYMTFIDPTSFTLNESILVLSMVIIGGAGTLRGPLFGAALLIVMPELLRLLGLPSAIASSLRQVFYGLLLVLILMFRPKGLVGKLAFRR